MSEYVVESTSMVLTIEADNMIAAIGEVVKRGTHIGNLMSVTRKQTKVGPDPDEGRSISFEHGKPVEWVRVNVLGGQGSGKTIALDILRKALLARDVVYQDYVHEPHAILIRGDTLIRAREKFGPKDSGADPYLSTRDKLLRLRESLHMKLGLARPDDIGGQALGAILDLIDIISEAQP